MYNAYAYSPFLVAVAVALFFKIQTMECSPSQFLPVKIYLIY